MSRAHPRRPSRRATRRGIVLSAAGALALAAGLVWQSAYAGFSVTTPAVAATVGTGTVALTNEIEGISALSLPAMRPGDTFTECIIVTSTGSVPAEVRLYARDRTSTPDLTSYLNLAWTAGTGGGVNADCAGFVSAGTTVSTTMSSFATSFAGGILPWKTVGGTAPETRTYQFTFTLSKSAPARVKGGSARLTFVWEAQNQ